MLDPEGKFFSGRRVISLDDVNPSRKREDVNQTKCLDLVLGLESGIIILDVSESTGARKIGRT